MTTHDIDKTLKKIDKDLAENEQPLPKAAPTQHHLNQRPPEREVDLTVASFDLERLRELQELASLPGLDMSSVVSYSRVLSDLQRPRNFKMRCQQCNFKFESQHVDLFDLAHLHASKNQHTVVFSINSLELTIAPEKRTWGVRFLEFFRPLYTSKWWGLWCLFFMVWSIAFGSQSSGIYFWVHVGGLLVHSVCLALWVRDYRKRKR